jgi:peptidylprolyl isomerase/FKBP-type peptidyl-prolyl cis-trans isomerase FkpA
MNIQNDNLKVEDIIVGAGAEAVPNTVVTVQYTGTFTDGKVFDTSKQEGRGPFEFMLGAGMVIQGWDLGVAGMKVGGKRKLTIGPEFAYGARPVGPIPANSTLVFEVELLDVKGE